MIVKYAVLAGALELLPQSLATMAIVPLQMKLVYAVGQEHGYTLDSGHLREFLAVAGVGMTSQVFEGYARKLFGKAAKRAMGKGGKKVAAGATGALLSFATTYGLGQVAKVYYAGGRTLSQGQIQGVFEEQLERGKTMFAQHQGRGSGAEPDAQLARPAGAAEDATGFKQVLTLTAVDSASYRECCTVPLRSSLTAV